MDILVTANDSLQQAIDSAKNGDTIHISDGVQRLRAPVFIGGKQHIKITGEKDTVLSGSILLSGTWEHYSKTIYRLCVEAKLDIEQLYLNGKRYTMARYPNENPAKRLNGYAEDTPSPERTARWKDPTGGYIRALHVCEWGGNDYIIDGKNNDGSLQLRWVGDNNRGSDHHKKYILAENIFEELDAPGEWFYDKQEGFLYVIPEEGMDLSDVSVEAAVCGELFQITDSCDISISNITLEKTKRTLFCSSYEKITRSDWAVARKGAIYTKNCSDIHIADCRFSEIGGNCIFVDSKNTDILVENCDFVDCGASGVCVFGNQECVRDLSTWEDHRTTVSDTVPGPAKDDYPRDIIIKGCYFYNLGIYEKQSSPVSISVSSRVSVIGCTMHHLPRAGINVCDGSFGGHRLIDNLVFDTVRETGDHGPFNSWGRDRYWSLGEFDTMGQHGAKKRKFALLDAIETTVIAHNMFCGEHGFGIDLDDGSSNYLITKNYCVGVGIKLREGFLRTVRNNFILDACLDLHCTFEQNDDLIENNIIVSEKPLCIIAQNKAFTTRAVNNLFVGAKKEILTDELFRDNKNYICPKGDSSALSMHPNEIYFEPFSLEFGRKDKPKPELKNRICLGTSHIEFFGATLTEVDDSVRSMAGLPDYDGAFVEEICKTSVLYALGLRKHDVILSLGGDPIHTPQDARRITDVKKLHVVRAQKHISLGD